MQDWGYIFGLVFENAVWYCNSEYEKMEQIEFLFYYVPEEDRIIYVLRGNGENTPLI